MRRPVMYLAGLLLATGASLALAGPASAAASHYHPGKCAHHSAGYLYDLDDEAGGYNSWSDNSIRQEWNLLSGIGIGVLGSGLGIA